jgi:hypothetical protein
VEDAEAVELDQVKTLKKRLMSNGGSVQDQHVDKEDAGYVGLVQGPSVD